MGPGLLPPLSWLSMASWPWSRIPAAPPLCLVHTPSELAEETSGAFSWLVGQDPTRPRNEPRVAPGILAARGWLCTSQLCIPHSCWGSHMEVRKAWHPSNKTQQASINVLGGIFPGSDWVCGDFFVLNQGGSGRG